MTTFLTHEELVEFHQLQTDQVRYLFLQNKYVDKTNQLKHNTYTTLQEQLDAIYTVYINYKKAIYEFGDEKASYYADARAMKQDRRLCYKSYN